MALTRHSSQIMAGSSPPHTSEVIISSNGIPDDATCPVCMDKYNLDASGNPVMLPGCGHTICRSCLVSIYNQAKLHQHHCPICRAPYTGPHPCTLPANYLVLSMMQTDLGGSKEGSYYQKTHLDGNLQCGMHLDRSKINSNYLNSHHEERKECSDCRNKKAVLCCCCWYKRHISHGKSVSRIAPLMSCTAQSCMPTTPGYSSYNSQGVSVNFLTKPTQLPNCISSQRSPATSTLRKFQGKQMHKEVISRKLYWDHI